MTTSRFSLRSAVAYAGQALVQHTVPLLVLAVVMIILRLLWYGLDELVLGKPLIEAGTQISDALAQLMSRRQMTPEIQFLRNLIKEHIGVILIYAFIVWIAWSFFFAGFTRYLLDLYDTGTARIAMLFTQWKAGLRILVVIPFIFATLTGLLVLPFYLGTTGARLIGMLLSYGVMLYLYARVILIDFCIVDKNLGPWAAFVESWRLTHGAVFKIAILWGILRSIEVLLQLLFLGFVASIIQTIFFLLCFTYVYRTLLKTA